MGHHFLAGEGVLWIQPDGPGTQPRFLGCHMLGDLTIPKGDVTLLYCPDPSAPNKFQVVNSYQSAPGAVTTTITTDIQETADYLEGISCKVPIYVMLSKCGRKDVFTNYDRAFLLHRASITSEGLSNLVARTPDDQNRAEQSFDISAEEMTRTYAMTVVRQSISETAALNDIAFCNSKTCGGECGEAQEICEVGYAVAKAIAGDSPASQADVWKTINSGGAWSSPHGTEPFDASQDIAAVVCFPISRDITRVIVANGTSDAGNPAEIAYSDDGGTTWTAVNVGSTNGQYFTGPYSLFALDYQHIWACVSGGYIYFSADGGLTFTTQEAGVITAQNWKAIHFSDYDHGFVVGNTNTGAFTIDGGSTWSALTLPTAQAADNAITVWAIDSNTVWIGYDDGKMYRSVDAGENFTEYTFSGSGTGSVKGISFANELCGFMIHDNATPVGTIFKTINGGYDWEAMSTPTNTGLNSLYVCDCNTMYAVGNASGGTAVVFKGAAG